MTSSTTDGAGTGDAVAADTGLDQAGSYDVGSDGSLRRSRWPVVVSLVSIGVLLLIGGLLAGRFTAPTAPPTPGTTSAEAGFARDMQTHHNQAVEMALLEYRRTDDAALRTLSYDIAASQSQQAGQMYGWLASWGLPQAAPEPTMTWMTRPALDGSGDGHDTMSHDPGERMPGLATSAQLGEFRDATGVEADRIFLQLMIAHHEGGVEMAGAVLDRSDEPVVTSLATGIITVQEGEIDYMNELLAGLPV